MTKLEEHISSGVSEMWEKAYYEIVKQGTAGIDELILLWIWHNTKISDSREYSIFSPNVPLEKNLLNVEIRLSCYHKNRGRFLRLCCWDGEDIYPYFDCTQEPDIQNIQYASIGNPSVDSINYRKWEEFLFYKMLSEILLEKGGINAIAEGIRRKN